MLLVEVAAAAPAWVWPASGGEVAEVTSSVGSPWGSKSVLSVCLWCAVEGVVEEVSVVDPDEADDAEPCPW